MIKANFNTYNSYVTDSLYQWDLNQVLNVSGLNLTVAPEVHFSNANMDKAIPRQASLLNHVVSVAIPNSLLQDPLTIEADIGIYEGDTFKVIEKICIPIIPKKRPSDYQIQDSDEEIYSFKALENAIKNMVKSSDFNSNQISVNSNITKVQSTLDARIDNIIANASDTGDNAELIDIRLDAEGTTHESAGKAVRTQITNVNNILSGVIQKSLKNNPFQPLLVNEYSYYKGGNEIIEESLSIPQYDIVDFERYVEVASTSGTTFGAFGKLVTPIPVFSECNGEYVLLIKVDKEIDIFFLLGYYPNWYGSNNTFLRKKLYLKAGYNVIRLSDLEYNDAGYTEFRYVGFSFGTVDIATSGVNDFEVYFIKSDALIGGVESTIDDRVLSFYKNIISDTYHMDSDKSYLERANVNGVLTVENCRLIGEIAETTNDNSWHYSVLSYYLGTKVEAMKKVLFVRLLDTGDGFNGVGIGKSKSQWANAKISNTLNVWQTLKLADLINSNSELSALSDTADLYFCLGNQFNNITPNLDGTYTSPAYNVSYDLLEVNIDHTPVIADTLYGFNPEEYPKYEDLNITEYITCWGDSLTAQGGWTTTLAELTGRTVYNGGTGGENVKTIIARQGADVMIVNDITIPADLTPVTIASRETDGGILTEFNNIAMPLLQGGAHVNPCYIGDIKGTLSWTGSSYSDTTGTWTFTRAEVGDEVVIKRPTALRTDFDINKNNPYLMIIYIGQNGGYDDLDDLVNKHKLMINHANAKHVLILGLSSGTKELRAEYEARMRKEFGRYFVSLREYLSYPIYKDGVITSCYGLEDAGLTPTEDDLTAIEAGQVPSQLLKDAVHYTDTCRTVIGNMLYKKCKDLNIF